jgi:serine/threonine protein kinase
MHQQRIVHLDIKPNNIMFATSLPTDLRIKVIDLGLARELGGSEKVLSSIIEQTSLTSACVVQKIY